MRKIFLFFFLMLPLIVNAQEAIIPVVIDGDQVTYSKENERVVASGNVVMEYQGVTLRCQQAQYDVNNNTAYIPGEVTIEGEQGKVTGQDAVYDFKTKEAEFNQIYLESPPIYAAANKGQKATANEYIFKNGFVTTCDLKNPHYRLSAKRIAVYPGDKVVARNLVLKVGKIPVFYFPYYSQKLADNSFPAEVSVGKDNDWGAYILTRWRYYLGQEDKGKVSLDYYQDRGPGVGLVHQVNTKNFGQGLFNLYYLEDQLYGGDNQSEIFDLYPERSSLADKYLQQERFKGQFAYAWNPSDRLSLRAEYNKLSDPYFIKDFFYEEYEREPHPYSYFLADYAFNNSSLSLLAQKRVNRFFTETEYLPKLEYNFYNQRINDNYPLYFRSKSFISNTTRKNANSGVDQDATRIHAKNIFSYRSRLGPIAVTPYSGLYTTYYSKNTSGKEDLLRQAPAAGITFNTKFYKILNYQFNFLGEQVEKMRHIITPTLAYDYIHSPTLGVDQLGNFDSVDDIDRQSLLTFTLENKWQARNEERTWDYLYFSNKLKYRFNKEGKGSYFDSVESDLEFYPTDFFSVTADSTYDCLDRAFSEANLNLRFNDLDEDKYAFSVGQRYARDESSQTTFSLTYQLTSKLQFRNYLRYESETGEMEKQEFFFRRDLHCWWMDFGVEVNHETDLTFWIIFRIKAFPDVRFGFDHSYDGGRDSY
jgi:lipopolysaccharide export system protein LptA